MKTNRKHPINSAVGQRVVDNPANPPRTRALCLALAALAGFATSAPAQDLAPTITLRGDSKIVATFSEVGSGIWTIPDGVSSVEVLVLGGGGAGSVWAGGSGAGGMYYTSLFAVTPQSGMTITVGAGGTAGGGDGNGGNGQASQFGSSLIAYGGIHGMGYSTAGGGNQGAYSLDGGTTIVPGRAAAEPRAWGWWSGSGAGAPGTVGDSAAGGMGAPCSITGTETYYAGGGGANAQGGGGLGGGGNGADTFGGPSYSGVDGLGGGAGGGWGGTGANGGSGVVILAYQVSSRTVTTTALVSDDNTSTDNQSVTFTATVKVDGVTATGATGSYEFKLDGNVVEPAAAIVNGVATYTTSTLTTGGHTVTATYAGNTTYEVSAASITQTNVTPHMLTFSFGALGDATIDRGNIDISVPPGTPVTSLSPTYTTTANATGAPESAAAQDFTAPVTYTLTSTIDTEVLTSYTVTVTVRPFVQYSTREDGKTVATFTAGSGTWTVPAGVTLVEVLVVGGGGGGDNWASGSGAGGMFYTDSYAVTPESAMAITVGTGGIRGDAVPGDANGGDGQLSKFGDLLIAYGGIHGMNYSAAGGGIQGAYSLDGGNSIVPGSAPAEPRSWGWWSGSGAAATGTVGDSAAGGAGSPCSITGTETYYAGGGGANASGLGGLGGGGNGADTFGGPSYPGVDGLGGGAGGGWGGPGGNGGSGIVIVAYLAGGATPYATWAAGISGFTDTIPAHDPDGDGMSNQQEFAFGLNPTKGSSVNPVIAPLKVTTHTFSYTRYAASGLSYTVWTSTDLQAWNGPAVVTENVGTPIDGVSTVEVTLTSPPAGGNLFVRVQAQ